MTAVEILTLLPFIIIAATSIVVMLTIAFCRSHGLTALLTAAGLLLALAALPMIAHLTPRGVTPLLVLDRYALFYTGLILSASLAVAALSYSYLTVRDIHREELYVLLLIAALGAMTLTASAHFASFFLGIETLTVSLYALTAYLRDSERSIEAGVKYLILAAVSSAFILFGMALVYAETASLEFSWIAARIAEAQVHRLPLSAGLALIVVGIGFKLAVVPFHMWTPDIYEGAPAPVTAFVATVSKGAVFAVMFRYFGLINIHENATMLLIVTVIAVASMFAGNLLALLQNNVKRILAYSSIAHLGYLLISFLASGPMAATASAFYLAAYFVTTLGAFGVVTVLSEKGRDADGMDDYHGMAWRRPWLAGVFTAMLLSLAGMPLTAGFVGKFYIAAAGVGSSLWLPVVVLVVNSAIGLFYYLRIIMAMYSEQGPGVPLPAAVPLVSGGVLAALTLALIWLGVYPGPVIELIKRSLLL